MPLMTDEGDKTVPTDADDVLVSAEETTIEVVAESEGGAVEEVSAGAEPVGSPSRTRGPSPRTVAVIAAFAALLGGAGFLGWQVFQDRQLKAAAEEAQRAAVSYAQVLTSIDSDKVDENFKEVLDGATGEFKDMYTQSSVELRQLLIENKATARGVVIESAVQSASKDKAVVLLFVDQSVSNAKLPDPRIDRSRMKMTLEKVDGRWRASKVELP